MNTFYLLVAGSRTYNNYTEMCNVLDFLLSKQVEQGRNIVIVSGGAKGADTLAERYAKSKGYGLHVIPADWNKYGRGAGYHRNVEMHVFISNIRERRGCVCFWNMKSPGTKHNFALAKMYCNPLRVYNTSTHSFLTEEEVEAHT